LRFKASLGKIGKGSTGGSQEGERETETETETQRQKGREREKGVIHR
jgi:hypothetical protein